METVNNDGLKQGIVCKNERLISLNSLLLCNFQKLLTVRSSSMYLLNSMVSYDYFNHPLSWWFKIIISFYHVL